MSTKKRGLGRGLDALFDENATESGGITTLRLSEIEPNRNQPRKDFDEEALSALADSISKYGVLQPLIVRPKSSGAYQLVAGERRWRASRIAGLASVPVIIKPLDDEATASIALVENLQREDLSVIEEAQGYAALMEGYGMTQEKIAEAMGKSRPAVANTLRLLTLPDYIISLLKEKKISAGHARALLSFDDPELQKYACDLAVNGATVRAIEQLSKKKKSSQNKPVSRPRIFEEAELSLTETLGRRVKIKGSTKKGVIEIEFYGTEDLKNISNLVASEK